MDLRNAGAQMSEADTAAIRAALSTNPLAMAEAEGHLRKGLLILSEQIGIDATRNLVAAALARLEDQMPHRRAH